MALTYLEIQSLSYVDKLSKINTLKEGETLINQLIADCLDKKQYAPDEAASLDQVNSAAYFINLLSIALKDKPSYKAAMTIAYEYLQRFTMPEDKRALEVLFKNTIAGVGIIQPYQLLPSLLKDELFSDDDTQKIIEALADFNNLYERISIKINSETELFSLAELALKQGKMKTLQSLEQHFGAFFIGVPEPISLLPKNLRYSQLITRGNNNYLIPSCEKIISAVKQISSTNNDEKLKAQNDLLLKFTSALQDIFDNSDDHRNDESDLYPYYNKFGYFLGFLSCHYNNDEDFIKQFIDALDHLSKTIDSTALPTTIPLTEQTFFKELLEIKLQEHVMLIDQLRILSGKISDINHHFDTKTNTLPLLPAQNVIEKWNNIVAIGATVFGAALTMTLIFMAISGGVVAIASIPTPEQDESFPEDYYYYSVSPTLIFTTFTYTPLIMTVGVGFALLCCIIAAFWQSSKYDKDRLFKFPANTITELSTHEMAIRQLLNTYLNNMNSSHVMDLTAPVFSKDYLEKSIHNYQDIQKKLEIIAITEELSKSNNKAQIKIPAQEVQKLVQMVPARQRIKPALPTEKKSTLLDGLLAWKMKLTKQSVEESRLLISPEEEVSINMANIQNYNSIPEDDPSALLTMQPLSK